MVSELRRHVVRWLALLAMSSLAACGRISGLDDLYLMDAGGSGSGEVSSSAATHGTSSVGGSAGSGASVGSGASSAGGGGSAGAGGSASTSYSEEVLADGPVAYWRLGEAAGTITAVDATGNMFDGSYYGAIVSEDGAIAADLDRSMYLDQLCPAGDVEKGVDVPDATELEFVDKLPFTFEAWIRPMCASGTIHRRILEKASVSGTYPQGYTFYVTGDGGLVFYRRGATNSDYVTGPATAPFAEWSYVAVVFDGSEARIFVNGAWGEPVGTPVNIQETTANFRIGAASNDNFAFAGGIDEVAVYDKPLADTRILAHYQLGLGLAR